MKSLTVIQNWSHVALEGDVAQFRILIFANE